MDPFVADFIRQLEPFERKLGDNYEARHLAPVVLPPMPFELPSTTAEALVGPPIIDAQTKTKVTLKSVRAPKYTVEYEVPITESIYSVKERLVSDPDTKVGDLQPSQIHLLLKAKPVADSRQLKELASHDFTVMTTSSKAGGPEIAIPAALYWGDYANFTPTNLPTPPVEIAAAKPGLTTEFWKELEHLVARYVEDPEWLVAQFQTVAQSQSEPDLD